MSTVFLTSLSDQNQKAEQKKRPVPGKKVLFGKKILRFDQKSKKSKHHKTISTRNVRFKIFLKTIAKSRPVPRLAQCHLQRTTPSWERLEVARGRPGRERKEQRGDLCESEP